MLRELVPQYLSHVNRCFMVFFICTPLFSIKMRKYIQANQITKVSFGWLEVDFLFGTEMGLYKQKNTLNVNGKLVIRKGPKQIEQGYKFLSPLCDIKDHKYTGFNQIFLAGVNASRALGI